MTPCRCRALLPAVWNRRRQAWRPEKGDRRTIFHIGHWVMSGGPVSVQGVCIKPVLVGIFPTAVRFVSLCGQPVAHVLVAVGPRLGDGGNSWEASPMVGVAGIRCHATGEGVQIGRIRGRLTSWRSRRAINEIFPRCIPAVYSRGAGVQILGGLVLNFRGAQTFVGYCSTMASC